MTDRLSHYAQAAFLGGIGWQELVIFFVIVLIIFGPKRLPQLARSLGRAIQDFKRGLKEVEHDINEDEEPPKTGAQPSAPKPETPQAPSAEETKKETWYSKEERKP